MLIRSEFNIEFHLPYDVAMIGLLRLHPSLDPQVQIPEALLVEHLDTEIPTPVRLTHFHVESYEVDSTGDPVQLPPKL